jgi:hypothetical protein
MDKTKEFRMIFGSRRKQTNKKSSLKLYLNVCLKIWKINTKIVSQSVLRSLADENPKFFYRDKSSNFPSKIITEKAS